jgi:hypothetical protein
MATKRQRDYQLEYERRRIRANARGFSSPTEQTKYNRAKKENAAQGKKLTVYNYRTKVKATQRANLTKNKKARLTAIGTPTALKKFGVSEKTFNRIRAENRKFDRERAWGKIQYKYDVDRAVNDYSEERVGYIIGYNQAFVHPKTKTLTGKARQRQVAAYEKLAAKYNLLNDELEKYQGRENSGDEVLQQAA